MYPYWAGINKIYLQPRTKCPLCFSPGVPVENCRSLPNHRLPIVLQSLWSPGCELKFLILPGKLDRFRHLAEAESPESSSFFYKSCFFSVSLQLCTRPTNSAALALGGGGDDRVFATSRGSPRSSPGHVAALLSPAHRRSPPGGRFGLELAVATLSI